jgi:hypothetical protein
MKASAVGHWVADQEEMRAAVVEVELMGCRKRGAVAQLLAMLKHDCGEQVYPPNHPGRILQDRSDSSILIQWAHDQRTGNVDAITAVDVKGPKPTDGARNHKQAESITTADTAITL